MGFLFRDLDLGARREMCPVCLFFCPRPWMSEASRKQQWYACCRSCNRHIWIGIAKGSGITPPSSPERAGTCKQVRTGQAGLWARLALDLLHSWHLIHQTGTFSSEMLVTWNFPQILLYSFERITCLCFKVQPLSYPEVEGCFLTIWAASAFWCMLCLIRI